MKFQLRSFARGGASQIVCAAGACAHLEESRTYVKVPQSMTQSLSELVSPSILDAIALPRIVRLDKGLFAAAFVLMKLLPARRMLRDAVDSGELQPGSVVIESSSGTIGLALAMLCNQSGHRLMLVSDPAMDERLLRRVRDLGASVDIVTEAASSGGIQQARLNRLDELRATYSNAYWPRQYDNPSNPAAYCDVADLLAQALGRVDCLVGTVGSGGSMSGTARFLREYNPSLYVIGVDTHGSVIFGQKDARRRMLRGLGSSLVHPNVNHTEFDEVHWVSAAEGFRTTRALHRRHAMFMGPTSGAAYLVAGWYARRHPAARVVALLPDEGHRYLDTVYDDEWLTRNRLDCELTASDPVLVEHPQNTPSHWSRFLWGRRSYQKVMGAVCSGVH